MVTATMLGEAAGLLAARDYATVRTYGGIAPVTQRSGKRCTVQMRYACNSRLRNALHHWAFSSLSVDRPARAYYDAARARGLGHARALRSLADRWLRILIAMLTARTLYDPDPSSDDAVRRLTTRGKSPAPFTPDLPRLSLRTSAPSPWYRRFKRIARFCRAGAWSGLISSARRTCAIASSSLPAWASAAPRSLCGSGNPGASSTARCKWTSASATRFCEKRKTPRLSCASPKSGLMASARSKARAASAGCPATFSALPRLNGRRSSRGSSAAAWRRCGNGVGRPALQREQRAAQMVVRVRRARIEPQRVLERRHGLGSAARFHVAAAEKHLVLGVLRTRGRTRSSAPATFARVSRSAKARDERGRVRGRSRQHLEPQIAHLVGRVRSVHDRLSAAVRTDDCRPSCRT